MSEALIIGGGPAGSMAGLLLARGGWRVSLIEQHRFPRDKVCGECLSPMAIDVLESAGLLTLVRGAGGVRLSAFGVYASRRSARIQLTAPMLGLSRARFDLALLDAAREAGVTVHQPARCETVRCVGDGCEVVVRDLLSNRVDTLSAPHVVVADGKGVMLPRRTKATGDFGIKAHFAGVAADRDVIGLFATAGRYGGVAPIEGNRWNAAFSVKADDLADCHGDMDRVFKRLCGQNRFLAQQFSGAERIGEWLAAPLPRFAVARDWPKGVIPLGNAAAALEPVGGEGMGLALRSAELVAECLIAGETDHARIREEFARLWSVRRVACRSAARLIASPLLGNAVVAFLAGNQTIAQWTMQLTGKPAHSASSSRFSISDAW